MSDIRDFFIKTLDRAVSGIAGIMNRYQEQLKTCDFRVYERLALQDVKPQFYAFRFVLSFFSVLSVSKLVHFQMKKNFSTELLLVGLAKLGQLRTDSSACDLREEF